MHRLRRGAFLSARDLPVLLQRQDRIDEASGNGTIYTYSVMRRAPMPYAIAYVTLDEGPTMMTNIVDCDLDEIRIGQAVSLSSSRATAARRCRCSPPA